MKPEGAKKLRAACSLLAGSLIAVSIAGLVLTGVLSLLEQMSWAVGLFITLKMLAAVLLGGILGLAIGLLIGRKPVILFILLGLLLFVSILFMHLRVSDLLSEHTPAMSGSVAPIAVSLPHVGFLVGLVVGSRHFVRGLKGGSADRFD